MLDYFNYYDFYDGTLYLESFLILFANIYRVNFDKEEKALTITFISTKTDTQRKDDELLEKIHRALSIFRKVNETQSRIFQLDLKSDAYVNRLVYKRDIESLTPAEVKCIADLFEQFLPLEIFFDQINQHSLLAYTSHDEVFYHHDNFEFLDNYKSMKMSRSSAGVRMDKLIKEIVSALNEEESSWEQDLNIEGEI